MSKQNAAINLKGSAEIIAKYFGYSINSILYQRGIYPQEWFKSTQEYGLSMLVSTNQDVTQHLEKLLIDVQKWIEEKTVNRLAMLIRSVEDGEVLERWQFNIHCEANCSDTTIREKCQTELQKEIRQIIRQITSSVTFLPVLDCPCSFEIILYVDKDLEFSEKWGLAGAGIIENGKEVEFKNFSTKIHKVSTSVTYKLDD